MNYLISVISFLAFIVPLVRWLIPEDQQGSFDPVFVVALTVFYFTNRWHLRRQMTITKESVNEAQELVNDILYNIRDKMVLQINNGFASNLKQDDIRANVMLRVKGKWPFARRYIKMFYDSGNYTEEESNVKWYKGKKGSGTCGEAWDKARPVIFDSADERYRLPLDRLDKKHREVKEITEIKSVLSLQIKKRGGDDIIGVLNFDSKLNIDKTRFDERTVIKLGMVKARQIVYCLPTELVKL